MNDSLNNLTQAELLALALEASRRDDAGHTMAYLKEAAARPDASGEALFLLGSEYAQVGLVDEAKAHMGRAVAVAPGLAIARFQYGLLLLTNGEPDGARVAWAPLADMDPHHPQAHYLQPLHRGLLHLMADEFPQAIAGLNEGMAANSENAALNVDMRKIVDAIEHLPGMVSAEAMAAESAAAVPQLVDAPLGQPSQPDASAAQADGSSEAAAPAEEAEPSHLFIAAYTHRGKPH